MTRYVWSQRWFPNRHAPFPNFNRRFDGLSLEIFTPRLGINRHRLQPSTSSSAFLSVTILVAGFRERLRLRCRRSTRTHLLLSSSSSVWGISILRVRYLLFKETSSASRLCHLHLHGIFGHGGSGFSALLVCSSLSGSTENLLRCRRHSITRLSLQPWFERKYHCLEKTLELSDCL